MEVVVDLKVYEDPKIHNSIIAQIVEIIQEEIREKGSLNLPRAKRKGEVIIRINGAKYAVICRNEKGKITITNVRKSRKMRLPWNK